MLAPVEPPGQSRPLKPAFSYSSLTPNLNRDAAMNRPLLLAGFFALLPGALLATDAAAQSP